MDNDDQESKDIRQKVQELHDYIESFEKPASRRPRKQLETDYGVVVNGVVLLSKYATEVGQEYVQLKAAYDDLVEYVESIKTAIEEETNNA